MKEKLKVGSTVKIINNLRLHGLVTVVTDVFDDNGVTKYKLKDTSTEFGTGRGFYASEIVPYLKLERILE